MVSAEIHELLNLNLSILQKISLSGGITINFGQEKSFKKSSGLLSDWKRPIPRCFTEEGTLKMRARQSGMASHLGVLSTVIVFAFLSQATGQTPESSTLQSLQQRRMAIVQDLWANGYTCLKPDYRPSLQSVQASLATPQAVQSRMLNERQILTDSQQALKTSQIADSHWRFLGKALDMMMGALINAGTGKGGKVQSAERVFSAQGFIDQANTMIDCTNYRQQKLQELAMIDKAIAQKNKPLRFPDRPDSKGKRDAPLAF